MLPTFMAQVAQARLEVLALMKEHVDVKVCEEFITGSKFYVNDGVITEITNVEFNLAPLANKHINVDLGLATVNKLHNDQSQLAVETLVHAYDKKKDWDTKSVVLPVPVLNGEPDLSAYAACEDADLSEYVIDGIKAVDFPARFEYATRFILLPLNGLSGLEGPNFAKWPKDEQEA